MSEAAFKARCEAFESAIGAKELMLEHYNGRLGDADEMEDEDDATAVRKEAEPDIGKVETEIVELKQLLEDVKSYCTQEENRVIGHVILSPPITPNYGDDGFNDGWAVVQVDSSMIAKFNIIGNAIDFRSVAIGELANWMQSQRANTPSFKYPSSHLLHFTGMVSDQEMYGSNPKNNDNDPVIMVLKNGSASNLTVGGLNTIRALTRIYSKYKPAKMSKEVCVLPRSSRSGPFSYCGDSGSAVVDGKGRLCGILTGGSGASDVSDCSFVTSINFLIKRLAEHGFKANILFKSKDL